MGPPANQDEITWTLKDGVLILKGSECGARAQTALYSPFWHNPYIETIVIDGRILNVHYFFRNDLPNLKTVVLLGPTRFRFEQEWTMTNYVPGDFPEDHDITFIFENCYKDTEYKAYKEYYYNDEGNGPAISTEIGFNKWNRAARMYGQLLDRR